MSETRSYNPWIGRVLTALPTAAFLASGTMKLMGGADGLKMFVEKFGYPASALAPIGAVELTCAALYAIPRTSALGAVLLTGYLGGAVATHVRVGDPFVAPVIFGVVVWAGLYFRDARVRAVLPLRAPAD
ncbi:MAG: DoxX family protein [Deltaproteobacteria bacterium]|nr:DoxX family protein [Deltaproteobacteria bacterium]